ncbi:hypothetical protein IU443_28255 [Nocardia farcinica]|uniref:hypothetical protein n=1 Tax=Nocardia farcinica TaxID=37329 RepID=UPI001895E451|nr:hypothetical protein [Nocardia farcinica]MBF6393825.1 hypothetical protein [Nocardia farcinica]UEX26183.1 hypothetical protein LMJ57_30340 [Nocardia farcinica]
MSRMTDDGQHEGYVAWMFADGMYGGHWSDGPVATNRADGTGLPWAEWQRRTDAEVTGWRPICEHGGRECWRGQFWTRVTAPGEHDPAQHRIYSEDAFLDEDDNDLILREWEAHIAPLRGTADVRYAAAEVAEAEARLTAAVAAARKQGASWEAIGRAAGMTRQSAHERWARVIA